MPYQIIDVATGDFVSNDATFSLFQFDTGGEANEMARILTERWHGERKFRVKRVMDTRWKSREQRKMEDGTYQHVPWGGNGWWNRDDFKSIWAMHYPHVSRQTPGMMAYTENVDKGMDNKQTQIKPGKYLAKYFSHLLTKETIKDLAHQFADLHEERKLFFAETEDDIQRVYEKGPASCMSSAEYRANHSWGYPVPGKWPDDYHACRIYAAGDLQVAYLMEDQDDPDSEIIARALVWPAKKTHSRIYGDMSRMAMQLQRMGYRFGAPMGAKMLRKPFQARFIAPYIDAGQQSGQGSLYAVDKKTHLVICSGERNTYACNSTNGLSSAKIGDNGEVEESSYCEHCESDIEGGEMRRVHFGAAGGDYHMWCAECCDENTFQDCFDSRLYTLEGFETVELHDGSLCTARNFERHGFTCSETGRNLHRNRAIRLNPSRERVDREWAEEYCFCSQWSGEWWRKDQLVVMHDGSYWAKPEVQSEGFKCDDCGEYFHVDQRRSRTLTCRKCAAAAVAREEARQAELNRPVVAEERSLLEPALLSPFERVMQDTEADYRAYLERQEREGRGA